MKSSQIGLGHLDFPLFFRVVQCLLYLLTDLLIFGVAKIISPRG